MLRYVALLRGINVGGSNLIKMPELRTSFEAMGFADVATYIQSGNVTFATPVADSTRLEQTIEGVLSKRFKYASRVVVVSHGVLKRIVKEAPQGFGAAPKAYRYDVIFLKTPLTPARAFRVVEARDGVDRISAGRHALYFSRLISRAAQSRLARVIQKPEYQYMTIRNWNTTTRLLALMDTSADRR
jgi:uncharacterized protein (DUF1697 family)